MFLEHKFAQIQPSGQESFRLFDTHSSSWLSETYLIIIEIDLLGRNLSEGILTNFIKYPEYKKNTRTRIKLKGLNFE